MHVDGPVRHARAIQGADFDFLKAVTTRTPKVTIPSPTMLHFRGGRAGDQRAASTPTSSASTTTWRPPTGDEIADLAAAGCRYLQLDDTNLAYLCDPEIREATPRPRRRPGRAARRRYAALINDAIARPPGRHGGLHPPVPRQLQERLGRRRAATSRWPRCCSASMDVDGFFLEYDDERSGDFAPLRFVPKGKTVVLGPR